MPFEVSQVIEVSELDELMEMDYEAWQTPYIPQLKHFRPSFSTRAESIAYAKARKTKKLLSNDPNCFFVKITDTETKEVVGAATWIFNGASDGTDDDEKAKVEWYPEGSEEREFAECFIDGLSAFLARRLTRAHMDLLTLAVHPAHRKRGAARMLVHWGTDKADELGIEAVIHSFAFARGAYERCGFGCIERVPPNPELGTRLKELQREGKGQKWEELLEEDLTGWLMWRPIGRDFVKGRDVAPWI